MLVFPIVRKGANIALIVSLLLAFVSVQAQDGGLYQTFDSPDLPGWEHSPDVTVADGVARIPPNGFLAAQGAWGDFTLTIRLRRIEGQGEFIIFYRATDAASNYLSVHGGGFALGRREAGQMSEMTRVPTGAPADGWFDLTLQVVGSRHVVLLGGQPVIDFTEDLPPLPPASVILNARDVGVEVDEMTVIVGEEVALPVETSPEQPAVTPATPAYEAGAWVRLGGPPGGLGYDIRMRPDNPDVMYVTDANAGIFKSVDGGLTWAPINTGIEPIPGAGVPVFCATVDPHDYNVVWAGTQFTGHLYRSADGGQTWEARDNGISKDGRSLRGITIDPNDASVVYVGLEVEALNWGREHPGGAENGVGGEVYKSTDGGLNWTRIWQGEDLARYVWVDPRNSNRIYVSTGIFDRIAANADPAANDPGGVGILRSDDGGQTWTVLDERNGLGGRIIPSLFMHPTDPDLLIAAVTAVGDRSGVFVSRDGGDTWERILAHPFGLQAVEIATGNPDVWYAAGEGIFYRSDDAGQTWQTFPLQTADRSAGMPIDLQVDPRDSYRVFDNNYAGGNFLSTDGGETWVDASVGYTGASIDALLVLPDSTVLAGANTAMFRSTDGGSTWFGTGVGAMTGSVYLPGHILIPDKNGHLYHSTDEGATWSRIQVRDLLADVTAGLLLNDVFLIRALAVMPSDPQVVYAGFTIDYCIRGLVEPCFDPTPGLSRSDDGGYTWTAMPAAPFDGAAVTRIIVHPQENRTLYAATAQGLYRSQDGGDTWQEVTALTQVIMRTPFPDADSLLSRLDKPVLTDVVFDPFDPGVIYVASLNGSVWRSGDSSASWQQAAAGMDPNEPVAALLPDPVHPGVIYAASSFSGVFVSTDGAQTWRAITDGLTVKRVVSLALSPDGGTLYAGTVGSGVYRLGTP